MLFVGVFVQLGRVGVSGAAKVTELSFGSTLHHLDRMSIAFVICSS